MALHMSLGCETGGFAFSEVEGSKILDRARHKSAAGETKGDRQLKLILTDNFCRSHPADRFTNHQMHLQ
ncbi:hypothetical protein [Microcoleus sp. bin38.metabat.b11b12b14.051]|uniref:hypothetical protein n=1 Tax=Microcoleus sp. bin38.metabat.b11b12b14.051 TaxID=2742709 RepID=UPI0025CE5B45|nr:hypothetical protein [Microcoleus sp. bin38.metabat.b11b12b14.051]